LPPKTTDAEGKAVFQWTPEAGVRPGNYTIQAFISGQAGVAASKTITVYYKASISVDKYMVNVGETLTITVTVTPPTADLTVTIKILDYTGAEVATLTGTTDAEGKAVFQWVVGPEVRAGPYTVQAFISGQVGVVASISTRVIKVPPVGGRDVLIDKFELAKEYVLTCLEESLFTITVTLIALLALALILLKVKK